MVGPLTVAAVRERVRPAVPVYLGPEPAYPALDTMEDLNLRSVLLTVATVRVVEPGTVKDDLAALRRFPA